MTPVSFDRYVIDTLMADLVLHDRKPSAFLVYLYLHAHAAARTSAVSMSHQEIADATGLSKSAVQTAVRSLLRRQLIKATRSTVTAIPDYTVMRPWRR